MNQNAYRHAEANYWKQYSVTPQERWLELTDLETQVRVLEVGEGEPLLFIHGGPNAGSVFAPLAAHLTDYRCIVLDRPGCGLSPSIRYSNVPHDVTFPNLLAACLDALGLKQASLVGSSFGGACALWFALRYPTRVRNIILMGCPPFIPEAKMPLFLRLMATPVVGQILCRLPVNRSGTVAFLETMGQQHAIQSGAIPESFYDWWISLGQNTDTTVNERELVTHGLTFRGMRKQLIISDERLRSLTHPTYVYWGEDDPLASAAYGHQLFSSMQNGTVDIISRSGHLPWLDNPAQAARHVRKFLLSRSH